MRPWGHAVCALLALGLAGCAATDDRSEPGHAVGPGPLTQFWRTLAAADAESGSDDVLVEERVAVCMAELGFDYTPVDTSLGYELVDPDADLGTREYAELYGYGVATDPSGFVAGGREEILAGGPRPDPNEAYVDAMSDVEREAYLAALWGATAEDDDGPGDGDPAPGDPGDGGCQGQARAEVEQMTAWRETPGYELALRGATDAAQDAQSDPRIVELESAWTQCMADMGFPGHSRPMEPSQDFAAEANAANERAFAGLGASPSEDELRAAWAQVDAELAEIAVREIAVAVADLDCQEAVEYAATVEAVTATYEQGFYDEHRDELEATLGAFLETSDGGGA